MTTVTAATEGTPDGRLTAIVLTHNEAAHIGPCLRTLQWADERLVVDDGSDDDTRAIAAAMGARVLQRAWDGWAGQRNFAVTQASHPWVLFVDADERVPLELADEIRDVLGQPGSLGGAAGEALPTGRCEPTGPGGPAGFWIPRQNLILGRWMRHAGWDPDAQLRLFRTDRGRYDPTRQVHELVQLDGPAGHLRHRLIHHNYVSWQQFWAKQRRYARDEARQLAAQGTRAKPRNLALQPLREFRRRYVTLEGYKAGTLGLHLCATLAAANLLMYRELWRLNHAELADGQPGMRREGVVR